jgi:hypothetical protein
MSTSDPTLSELEAKAMEEFTASLEQDVAAWQEALLAELRQEPVAATESFDALRKSWLGYP